MQGLVFLQKGPERGIEMACINPDGSLGPSARALLVLLENPLAPEEIAEQLKRPLFQIRSSLREMSNAQLVGVELGRYVRTAEGTRALNH